MKKTLSMLLSLIVILTAMAVCSVSASASTSADPKTLTPGSDHVIFIRDPDASGYLPGDGSGLTPDNPLKVLDHERFDPDAQFPKWYLQTELYQATEMLRYTGGTIVITGPVWIGVNETYGSGSTTKDFFTDNFGEKTIKFTSVYNGVDYRETNGAKLILETPAMMGINGQSIWENVDIVTRGTNRVISFNFWTTLVGEGVKCYPEDKLFEGIGPNYVSLSAGHRYQGGIDLTTNLVVQSGSYNIIAGGEWGVNNTRGNSYTNNMDGDSTVNLVLEGTTTVYGSVIGTNRQNAEFSGNVNIVINNGVYVCDIYGVGSKGLLNRDGILNIKINGGDFTGLWGLSANFPGYINNAPYEAILDLSDFSGTTESYNALLNATLGDFTAIIEKQQGIQNGWKNINNVWYYYENGQPVRNAWRIDSVGWCFLGEDGAMITNSFVKDSFGSAYITQNGYFYDTEYGWRLVGGKWYFIEGGYAVTNQWRQDSTGWCYLGEDGAMLTNSWMKDSTGWCFLDDGGYWDGIYYPTAAFTKNGWYFEEGNWYFYEIDVKVTEQWRADSMGWCYLSETGAMVTNGLVADSTGLAYITTDGYFYYTENGWRLIDDQWYFIEGGYAVANQWRQDSTGWCFLGEDGAMLTSTFVKDSTGWCYLNENGYWDGVYHDQIPA